MDHDTRIPLEPRHIDVWLTFYQGLSDEGLHARLRALLSDEERRQAGRFHFEDDRLRFLVTRALVRCVLSRYAAVAPQEWAFAANAYGKPEIAGARGDAVGLRFNLSHTSGLIALAVSRHRDLGVDVENLQTRQMGRGIASRFFAPEEVAELEALPPARFQDRFFEYWTFKESYIKARGMGLSLPLDQFSFHYPDEDGVRLKVSPAWGGDAARWRFWQCRPSQRHLLALCARRLDDGDDATELTVRTTVPLRWEELVHVAWLRRSASLSEHPSTAGDHVRPHSLPHTQGHFHGHAYDAHAQAPDQDGLRLQRW